MVDLINKPPHYNHGKIEPIDFILDQEMGYLAGQCLKYLVRYRWKGTPVQDLMKCRFYLDKLISQQEFVASLKDKYVEREPHEE